MDFAGLKPSKAIIDLKMIFRVFLCSCFLGLLILESKAQYKVTDARDTTFCVPSVEGLSRPKGFLIREEILTNHGISSRSFVDNTGESGEIRATRRREIKLKAPLVNKDNFKMAIGFKYRVEDIFFDDIEQQSFDFYHHLEDKNLKSLGTSIYIIKPWRGQRYFLLRASASLNGDYDKTNKPNADYFKYSIAPLIGWKKSDNLSYAMGIGYSQNFGRISVFPLFSYNQTFNDHFGVESMLPLNASFRYSTLDKKNYIYLRSKIEGATYNIDFPNDVAGYLNNTEIKYQISYEREIDDFIWVGVETGLRTNLNFSLSETPVRRISTIIDNNLNMAFFFGFSVFIVPPRKFNH